MNLQETIRRILREELSSRVRRRVPYDEMEKEFLESFEAAYDLTKRRKISQINFLDELIYTTVTMMMDGIHWRFVSTFPEDEFWYDDIHTELENHYKDRITQMYNERKGINESVLKEETEVPLFVRRRFSLEDLEWLVNDVKEMIDDGESLDTAIYDGVREFIKSKNFSDIDEFGLDADYWSTYLDYERPLVRYVKSKLNIQESILREEMRPLKVMRRTHLIDNEIAKLLDRVYYDKRICGRYDDANMFMNVVQEAVLENLYFNTFYMMDDTSEEWEKSVDFIYDYIKVSHGENLRRYFNNTCKENED